MMIKKLVKCIAVALAIFTPVYSLAVYVNPHQIFRLNVDQHDVVSYTAEAGSHVVGYGINLKEAELFYTKLKEFFGASYINRKVFIYRAKPITADGAIGKDTLTGQFYLGAYKQDAVTGRDVIIYNGNQLVLIHELTHFFYRHMGKAHKDEAFAYLTESYIGLVSFVQKYSVLFSILANTTKEQDTNVLV